MLKLEKAVIPAAGLGHASSLPKALGRKQSQSLTNPTINLSSEA